MKRIFFRVAPPCRKRHERGNLAWLPEACEERILLSATAMAAGAVAAKSTSPSAPPKIVRDPSSGGPNGTVYLANDATAAPNWAQQQNALVVPPLDSEVNSTTPALNESDLPVSGAFNVGAGVSLNGPALAGNVFGSPTFGNLAFNDQSLTQAQANYSTATFAFGNQPAASATGLNASPGLNAPNGLNRPSSLNGLGETLPVPDLDLAPTHDLDHAFMQTLDLTSPTGW
jgi:hypothetical protein